MTEDKPKSRTILNNRDVHTMYEDVEEARMSWGYQDIRPVDDGKLLTDVLSNEQIQDNPS